MQPLKEQLRRAPPANRLDLQRQSIMEIKRNVESIKSKNRLHRQQLEQYFLSHSQVQEQMQHTPVRQTIRPPMLRPDNPEQQPVKLSPKFKLPERMKTEQFEQLRRKSLANRTTYNFSVQSPSVSLVKERVETIDERPFRSDSIRQINLTFEARKNGMVQQSHRRHEALYNNQISSFQHHYEILNNLMGSLRKKQRVLQQCLLQFVNSAPSLAFIDEFISEYELGGQRTLRTSRILELVSIVYLVVEMSKGTLMDHYNLLVNAMGYASANLIFVAKLYIMREGSECLSNSRFEKAIDRFEKTAYYEQLTDERDILLRMQHNNEILSKIEHQLSSSNMNFEVRIRQFVKGYNREQYSYGLAFIFLFEYLAYYLNDKQLNGITPFLDVAPQPYLPPASTYKKHLVVIEPINVLVWQRNNRYYVRPYTHEFLEFLSESAEILLWTHLMPKQIEGLFDQIDNNRLVQHRLFKYHCIVTAEGLPIKDPGRLGRNVENIMFIDFDHRNIHSGFDNNLELFWKGSKRDRKLLALIDILSDMYRTRCSCDDLMKVRGKQLRELENSPPRRFPSKTLKLPLSKNHLLNF